MPRDIKSWRLRCFTWWQRTYQFSHRLIQLNCFRPTWGWPWKTLLPLGNSAWVCPERGEDLYHYWSNQNQVAHSVVNPIGCQTRQENLTGPPPKKRKKKLWVRCSCQNIKQHTSSYLLRLTEQEVMEMWVILHRLQQKKRSVSVFSYSVQKPSSPHHTAVTHQGSHESQYANWHILELLVRNLWLHPRSKTWFWWWWNVKNI